MTGIGIDPAARAALRRAARVNAVLGAMVAAAFTRHPGAEPDCRDLLERAVACVDAADEARRRSAARMAARVAEIEAHYAAQADLDRRIDAQTALRGPVSGRRPPARGRGLRDPNRPSGGL